MTDAMRIPLSEPDVTESEVEAVIKVLRRSRLSLGPALTEFEQAVAAYCSVPFSVAVSSGTSGLHLCVRALDIKEGDEVITTPFSFIASANAALYERARPVFVDIDPHTLNIDPDRIERAITSKTKAIIVVHVFGRPAPMEEILTVARRHKLAVIEDACEAIGAEYPGGRVGSLGDAGVFAFYPNKQITTGEGGMIITRDARIASVSRSLRNQGRGEEASWFEHTELGYNYRISELNCALGITQLKRLDSILEMRASVAVRYDQALAGVSDLVLPELTFPNGRISWFVYVVRLGDAFDQSDRDWIVAEMISRGIGCQRYFAPIHLQPLYRRLFGYREGDFPITEHASSRTIALPFFNRIRDDQIDEVCGTLKMLLRRRKTEQ